MGNKALSSAKAFSMLNPKVIGTGGLTLFPDTDLCEEASRGEFDPLDERGLMEELLLFVENLDFDGRFITHHTSSIDLNTDHFGRDKGKIVRSLKHELEHGHGLPVRRKVEEEGAATVAPSPTSPLGSPRTAR